MSDNALVMWALVIVVGVGLAIAAPAMRSSGSSSGSTVLVAKEPIRKGTPARLASFSTTRADGGVPDVSYLAGRVASRDIEPGETISVSDFAAASTTP